MNFEANNYAPTFYRVAVRTAWDWEKDQNIGFYRDKRTAQQVAGYVRGKFMSIPGGVDVFIHPHSDAVIQTNAGLRVKHIANGCIISIFTGSFDKEEKKRLKNFDLKECKHLTEYKWKLDKS